MRNNEFDDLLRKAISQRCCRQMPDTMALRVRQKCHIHARRGWLWGIGAAAAAAAVFLIVPGLSRQADSSAQQGSAPAFFVEAKEQTESRLMNYASVSGQLRKNMNDFYLIHQQ